MNTKVIGSVVRWIIVISGTVGAFMGDASFMSALDQLKESIASGNVGAIVATAGTALALGWSIWDKVKTQQKEDQANAQIKTLSETVRVQTAALESKKA
jgi:hypothetical protein